MPDLVHQVVADGVLFAVNRLLPVVADDQLLPPISTWRLPPSPVRLPNLAPHEMISTRLTLRPGRRHPDRGRKTGVRLGELQAAVAAVAGAPVSFDGLLSSVVAAAGGAAGDLAAQLGLTGAAAVSRDGDVIKVARSAPSASISAGPLFARGWRQPVRAAELGAEQGPSLTLTVNEASIGVAGDRAQPSATRRIRRHRRSTCGGQRDQRPGAARGGGTAATVQLPAVTPAGRFG